MTATEAIRKLGAMLETARRAEASGRETLAAGLRNPPSSFGYRALSRACADLGEEQDALAVAIAAVKREVLR